MSRCERIENCPFFNDQMANMPATSTLYKHRYCKEDHTRCARLHVLERVGPDAVPTDLFPNQWDRAEKIVKGYKGA